MKYPTMRKEMFWALEDIGKLDVLRREVIEGRHTFEKFDQIIDSATDFVFEDARLDENPEEWMDIILASKDEVVAVKNSR